ncbi:MAG: HEPN domain-containing protein [Candidatus Euphemobacter frigidus]|nr:HEPN domain-containing protein [Candidatus Euphemobacter frigidus]MDP8275363.1 HEPN domain-containing protein [Candidatus Euphemobacter frigidus]
MRIYEDLLKAARIRKEKVSRTEVIRALARSERDLKTARKIMAEDWDWGFAVTYNAVLQASRAYMFSQGYRPASAQGHKNTFAFMAIAMGKDYEDLITYFDRMRNKRNRAIYDVAGLITETEARNLFKRATEFVALIRDRLGAEK